jgi:preprotein translocase SecE subunit
MALIIKKTATDNLVLTPAESVQLPQLQPLINDKKSKIGWFDFFKNSLSGIVWPKVNQVLGWFTAIMFVCIFLATIMHFADNVYKAAFNFIDCSSPASKNQLIVDGKTTDTCFKDLPKQIINGI